MILGAAPLSASGRPELVPGEVELLLVDQVWLLIGLIHYVHGILDFEAREEGSKRRTPCSRSTRLLDMPPEWGEAEAHDGSANLCKAVILVGVTRLCLLQSRWWYT